MIYKKVMINIYQIELHLICHEELYEKMFKLELLLVIVFTHLYFLANMKKPIHTR